MRGVRSTIALVVILAGLGAYFYFVTSKLPEGGADAAKKQEKVFAGLDATKIEEIKVTSAAGDATTLKKDGSGWQIVQPITAKADDSEATSVTSALAAAQIAPGTHRKPADPH